MGEPIHLVKGKETMTVYGRHQAAVHVKEGWQLVSEVSLPVAPAAAEPETEPAKKPATRRKAPVKKAKGK